MPTVFASSGDSVVEKSFSTIVGGASWSSNVRGNATTTATSQDSTLTNYNFGIWNDRDGRGTGEQWKLNRSFFPFDLSGNDSSGNPLSGNTVASAELKVYSDNLGGTGIQKRIYAVEATALADSTDDYGNVFSSGTTLGTLFGSTTISTTQQYHTWTLNSDAISRINTLIGSGGIFTIGLMGYYDYNNSAPGSNELKIKVFYANNFGTSNDPKLELTFSTAAGYTHKVVSVAAGSIGKVNGVATANIGKVNSVD